MRPPKPSQRSSSAARNPARDAPTTTMACGRAFILVGSRVDDRDRSLGAAADGLFDLGAELVGRRLVEHVEEIVVADLEHFGRRLHAPGVALTEVEVDHHAVAHRHHSYSVTLTRSGCSRAVLCLIATTSCVGTEQT